MAGFRNILKKPSYTENTIVCVVSNASYHIANPNLLNLRGTTKTRSLLSQKWAQTSLIFYDHELVRPAQKSVNWI